MIGSNVQSELIHTLIYLSEANLWEWQASIKIGKGSG